MLSSDDSIKTVTYAVGYPDPLRFSNCFRRHLGELAPDVPGTRFSEVNPICIQQYK